MERADMSKSFHEFGHGNLAAGTFIAVSGPLISSKLRKEREEKIKLLKKERNEEERERRLCEWRAALEREAARKRQSDAERERRARELRERDAARRRLFDERRAELERRDEERRERILAKLNASRSPSAATSSTLAGGDASVGVVKPRSATASAYAFGSSTPRSLTYLTPAAVAGRGDAADAPRNHQTTPTADAVNGSPVRAISTVNLGRRLQSAKAIPSSRIMSASVHAVHTVNHTSPPVIKQPFPIRTVVNPRRSSDDKNCTLTPYKHVSASKHNTATTVSSARMTRSFVSPVKNADGKQSAPSTERQHCLRNQLKTFTVTRNIDKTTVRQETHLVKSRSSDEDGIENRREQEDKLKREEQEQQNRMRLQREAELQRRKNQEQERREAELKSRQEEEEQRQQLARQSELKRRQEEEELRRLRKQEEEEKRRWQEDEELRLTEEARLAEQERLQLAIEEEARHRRDEEARREEARRKQIEAETKLREAQERLDREKREAEERARKEEEERQERKRKLEAIMQRTRNAGVSSVAMTSSSNGPTMSNHTRWSPPTSAMAGADSPTPASSTAADSRHSMSSAALLQKYMSNRVDTSATRSSVENILAKVRSATALGRSSVPSHDAQLEPTVSQLVGQVEHLHNGTSTPAAGTFGLYDVDDETDRNSQATAVSSAATVTQFEVDSSSSASLSRFADLVRRPPATNNI